jgi:hypothetical protein
MMTGAVTAVTAAGFGLVAGGLTLALAAAAVVRSMATGRAR